MSKRAESHSFLLWDAEQNVAKLLLMSPRDGPANVRRFPMLVQCWPTVCDADPTLKQNWVDMSCLLVVYLQGRITPLPQWDTLLETVRLLLRPGRQYNAQILRLTLAVGSHHLPLRCLQSQLPGPLRSLIPPHPPLPLTPPLHIIPLIREIHSDSPHV